MTPELDMNKLETSQAQMRRRWATPELQNRITKAMLDNQADGLTKPKSLVAKPSSVDPIWAMMRENTTKLEPTYFPRWKLYRAQGLCGCSQPIAPGSKSRCQSCIDSGKRSRDRVRAQVIEAYGGCCACCGEANAGFLAIDHIYNDGKAQREVLGTNSTTFYRWLRSSGYPKDRFRLLCHNCNMGRQHYGVCPHETVKQPKQPKRRAKATPLADLTALYSIEEQPDDTIYSLAGPAPIG